MISFRWRMLRSFESCHDIGSSKCFRVPVRTTTGNAMRVVADIGACSEVDQSQVRFVSARGSERVGYTSSLLRISQFDMQVLRIWTVTSLEWRKWFARRKRYFAEATGTFSALDAYQGMNRN